MLSSKIGTILGVLGEQLISDAHLASDFYGDIKLLGGEFGDTCFLLHYARLNPRFAEISETLLEKDIASLKQFAHIGSYCNGLSGFALGLTLLERYGFIEGAVSALDSIDKQISICLNADLSRGNIDFLHGAIGYGFYFLERFLTSPEYSHNGLSAIVKRLDLTKIERGKGICWEYPKEKNDERFNISLSHGMSSIILFMSRIISAGIFKGENLHGIVCELLHGAVEYVLSQKLENSGFRNLYPSTWNRASYRYLYSRLAWCYGDLGVALALEKAAIALDNFQWQEVSRHIVEHSAKRRLTHETSVYDACVCHGAAGVWLMFNHFASAFDSPLIKDAANLWLTNMLKFYNPNRWRCFKSYNCIKGLWENKSGILEGISGIGFALLDDKRFINRVLLID